MSAYFSWLTPPLTFLLAYLLTAILIPKLRAYQVLSYPNDRSSHSTPIPRAGGISIVVAFFLAVIFLGIFTMEYQSFAVILFIGLSTALIGLWDDIKDVSSNVRLVMYAIAVGVGIYLLGIPEISVGDYVIKTPWLIYPLEFLVLLWVLNLFNFMDGIDAIASIEAISIAICAGLILAFHVPGNAFILPLFCLAAATGGFLIWNYPPAHVFMGDVASGFLGLTLALIGVVTSIDGSLNIWVWFILYGVFFVDATVSLLRRVWDGHPMHDAHRYHGYQRATMLLESKADKQSGTPRDYAHRYVSLAVLMINILWLLPFAFFSARHPQYGVFLTLVALLPLIVLALVLGAGKEPVDKQISVP